MLLRVEEARCVAHATSLNRPEYIEFIQKTKFESFEKGALMRSRLSDVSTARRPSTRGLSVSRPSLHLVKLLGETGIFTSDGHVWKNSRE